MNSYPRNPKYDFPEELVSGNKEYTFKLKGKNRDGQAVYDMIDNKTGETVGSEYSFSDNIGLKRIAYSVERPIELEEIKEFFSNTVDMAELEFELKRIKKENPGKKVTYFFTKDDPKGYKIQIKEFFSKPLEDGFTSGKQMINIKLKNYPKATAKVNQLIDMIGEDKFTMEMAEWIWDFFSNAHFERPVNEAKEESYMISKGGPKSNPYYVLEKPDGSKQIDMMFTSPEEAKKYATKKNLKISSKPGYNMNNLKEATKEEETKFHKKLDTLVHNTFGKRKGEMEEVVNYSPEGKDKIYSLISQALQQGKLTKDAQAVFMKWMADPNSTEEAIIKALESITGDGNLKEGELTEANVPSNIKEFAKRKGISSLVNKVAGWAEKVGARITGGTAIGKNYDTLILDMGYQTADIYINIEDGTIELYGEPADSFPQFKEAFMDKVTRDEIEKDENQFRREQGLEETLLERVFNRIKNDQSRTKR
jgi:hypothetical protein